MLDILKWSGMALVLVLGSFAGCTAPVEDGDSDNLPGLGGSDLQDPGGTGDDGGDGADDGPRSNVALNGAGATFPFPLLDKWSAEYNKKTGVKVNYQSIGSGGGIRAITDKTVDFAGSDAPLNAAQRSAASGLVHIPETLGAVVPAFNVPGVSDLKLTGPVLADIFLCKIKKWNDPAIADLNPDVELPNKDLITVHRSDGSGTTFVWVDYLSHVSDEWKNGPGKGTSVAWPCGLGGKGNEGVTGAVQLNPYTIGYVELSYAELQGLDFALVQNRAGNWIEASLETTSSAAAAAAASGLPAGDESWETVSIVDPAAEFEDAYPVASFTYLLVYKDLTAAYGNNIDRGRARALIDFIDWAIHDGQSFSSGLTYAPLPDDVVELNEATLRTITHGGEPVLD